jgi:hypothetical protein
MNGAGCCIPIISYRRLRLGGLWFQYSLDKKRSGDPILMKKLGMVA